MTFFQYTWGYRSYKNSLNKFIYFVSEIEMHRYEKRLQIYVSSRKRLTNQHFCTENNRESSH